MQHQHPDPSTYHATLAREERETTGVPAPLVAVPWALLAMLFALVVLAPSAPRKG